jgi:ubiquinone biosynthesis protein COQ4
MLLGIYARSGALPGARRTLRHAWQRGRRAAWLPAQDWEALLARDLDELRRELALGPPAIYGAVRSPGAPALAS